MEHWTDSAAHSEGQVIPDYHDLGGGKGHWVDAEGSPAGEAWDEGAGQLGVDTNDLIPDSRGAGRAYVDKLMMMGWKPVTDVRVVGSPGEVDCHLA